AVEVLDVRSGELVLERVEPGVPLASLATEDEAMEVVVRLFADDGWPPASADSVLEPLPVFARALDAANPALARAAGLLREVVGEAETAGDPERVVLHGDLHYGNVLWSGRARGGFLLIDPKGAIGDPAFDIGYLVSRPMPTARDRLPLARAIDRRL